LKNKNKTTSGYFKIAKESPDISFEAFWDKYILTEQPLIIENIASDWKARRCWTEDYLQKKLSEEPSAKEATLWYWMALDTLSEYYDTPTIVEKTMKSTDIFPRKLAMRIWVHQQGNVSSWHYDANMVGVFNVQVTGSKQWLLVSPDTPLDCYPFTNFGILDGKGDELFRNKIYTRFTLNEGDMLYLPPLWLHKVESCGEENISLNWVFTKKETQIITKMFIRDYERYFIYDYLNKHRFGFLRHMVHKINALLPNYLRIVWLYQELIKTPYVASPFKLMARIAKESAVLPKVILHINKIKPYMKTVKSVKRLKKAQ